MKTTGVYLYGFVPERVRASLDLSGVDPIDGDGPIRTLAIGGATAVVANVALGPFEAALNPVEAEGPDPAWLIPRALRHQAILHAVLAQSPVLPTRFGTLFSSIGALEGLAMTHQGAIRQFFDDLGDRLEWSLRGYLERDTATERMLESDPDLARRRNGLPTSPGTRYFLEKKLNEDARKAAGKAASKASSQVRQTLRTLSGDVRSLPLRGADGPGREMVLHETFLLDPRTAADAMTWLEREPGDGWAGVLTLEPSGPWPPFHFCPDLGGSPT